MYLTKANLFILKITGALPTKHPTYNYFMLFVITFYTGRLISAEISLIKTEQDVAKICENTFYCAEVFASNLCAIVMFKNKKGIASLIEFMSGDFFENYTKPEREIIKKSETVTKLFYNCYSIFCVVIIMFIFVVSVFGEAKKFPLSIWTPFVYPGAAFYFGAFFDLVNFYLVCFNFINILAFTVGVFTFSSAQWKVLNERLKNVNCLEELVEAIEFHRQLLSMKKIIANDLQPILSIFVSISLCSLATGVIPIMTVPVSDPRFVTCCFSISCSLPQSFCTCFLGNDVTHQSSLSPTALYSCNWMYQSQRFKTTYFIFYERLRMSVVKFKCLVLFDLSLELFVEMLKKTASYVTILRSLAE